MAKSIVDEKECAESNDNPDNYRVLPFLDVDLVNQVVKSGEPTGNVVHPGLDLFECGSL